MRRVGRTSHPIARRFDREHAIFSHEPSSLALFSLSPVRKWLAGFRTLVVIMLGPSLLPVLVENAAANRLHERAGILSRRAAIAHW